MAIVNVKVVTTPQDKVVDVVSKANTNAYLAVKNALLQGKRMIWENPDKLTPQQAVTAMGTDAAKLFQASGKSLELLALLGEIVSIMPDGWSFTPHDDGTVTVIPPSKP